MSAEDQAPPEPVLLRPLLWGGKGQAGALYAGAAKPPRHTRGVFEIIQVL